MPIDLEKIPWEGIIPSIVVGIIAIFTIYYAKRSHERTAIMDVFHMINNDKNKETEDTIIEAFKQGKLDESLKMPTFYENVKKVWRIYDQIGLLITKKLIPKDDFYLIVGLKMVTLCFCLSSEIEKRRLTRPRSLAYFTNIAIDCFEFYKKKKIQITNPATNGPIERSDLGDKIKL